MKYHVINSYIYFYNLSHGDVGNFIVLPSMPEQIQDSLQANFQPTNLLSRSAPIFTYSNSGPRSISVALKLHRDIMQEENIGVSNFNLELGDEYIDGLVKKIQAIALPAYDSETKLVDPPIVAIRFGDEVFIKGVISGSIGIIYSGPIISGTDYSEKYSCIDISFNINEIDPIDAQTIQQVGSFRSIPQTLERNIYKRGK